MPEFQRIYFTIVEPQLHTVSTQELSAFEEELGVLFPEDYREFICTFGAGEFINIGLKVLFPQDILDYYLPEVRQRLSEYWFWQESITSLTQARAIECIPCFDSSGGDDILFHPSDRTCLFILPHENEEIFICHSFQELCDWCANDPYSLSQSPLKFLPYKLNPEVRFEV